MIQPTSTPTSSDRSDTDLRACFRHFYENEAIRLLAGAERWTVSDSRKAPIDVRELIETGRLRGAWSTDEACLVSLDELTQILPRARNNAFYLRAHTDGWMVIDIEPTCPPRITAELLALPEVVYAERSMSGQGFHLIAPLPSNFWEHPVASGKTVLAQRDKFYEILLEHWVTFTRRPLEIDDELAEAIRDRPEVTRSTADLYAHLAVQAKENPKADIDIALQRPQIALSSQIVDRITRDPLPKTPQDFSADISRWEFYVLEALHFRMTSFLKQLAPTAKGLCDASYSESDHAWLLFEAAKQVLPYRPKHDELRKQRPYLLERSVALVALKKGALEQVERAERGSDDTT